LGLRATLMFELAAGEYHTNVLLAVLAGRAALICPDGFADAAVVAAIEAIYAPHALLLSAGEHAAFTGNAIALSDREVWMSRGADESLTGASREALGRAGFEVKSVALDAIEAAGGSLRCCVGEIY
ncbi:MAG: amidinotransferase, partial [Lysobacter sp.]|nr:amidinotransferase [Lysobacter sp.]